MFNVNFDVNIFKHEYLFKKPLFIKQGIESRVDSLKEFYEILFTPQLDASRSQTALHPSLVKVQNSTKAVSPEIWCHKFENDVYYRDIAALKKAIELKCSVIFDQYYRYSQQAKELVAFIQKQFNCISGCNAYLSQKGGVAFSIHRDAHHALIFSLSGKKRWKVFNKTQDMLFSYHEVPSNLTDEEIVEDGLYCDVLMCPGDVLYIPIGQFHSVENLTDNALHLTVSMAFRPALSILEDTIKALYTSESLLFSASAKKIINSIHPIHALMGPIDKEILLEQIVNIFDVIKEIIGQDIFIESQNQIYTNDLLKVCHTPTQEFIEELLSYAK